MRLNMNGNHHGDQGLSLTWRQTFKEHITNFNKAIWNTRQAHFSKVISKNPQNPKTLYSTIDNLINQLQLEWHSVESIPPSKPKCSLMKPNVNSLNPNFYLELHHISHSPLISVPKKRNALTFNVKPWSSNIYWDGHWVMIRLLHNPDDLQRNAEVPNIPACIASRREEEKKREENVS